MISKSCAAIVVAFLGVAALAQGAPVKPASEDKDAEERFHLIGDARVAAQLDAAVESIHNQEWDKAAGLLQLVLDLDEDRMAETGKEHPRTVSARVEARRLLAALPPAGQKAYQAAVGTQAADLLKESLKDKDEAKLEEIVRRFLYTDSGPDALEALAGLRYDAGHYRLAALSYDRLLELRDTAQWAPATLFRAADAFHRVGDKLHANIAGKKLLDRIGDSKLGVGERELGRDDVQKELSQTIAVGGDWPVFGGDAGRSAQGEGGMPFLVRNWNQPSMVTANMDRLEFGKKATDLFDRAANRMKQLNQPVLPSHFPVTATVTRRKDGKKVQLVVYRTLAGIVAADMKSGKLFGIAPIKGTLDWMMAEPGRENALNQWMQMYVGNPQGNAPGQRPGILFENTTIGTLSTDGEFAYAVEDLVVPPPAVFRQQMGFPGNPNPYGWPPELLKAVKRNRLVAFELAAGCKTVWDVPALDDGKSELADSYFLGPPLSLDGRLFVLTEKHAELRLVCLENVKVDGVWKPRLVFVMPLGTAREGIASDVLRRLHAAHLAYGDGVLVCPTNAGCVVGVDLLTHTTAWAYRYDEPKGAAVTPAGRVVLLPGLVPVPPRSEWRTSAPVVQDGSVVVAPQDSQALTCLDLKTGAVRWTEPRQNTDLYLGGVFDGRVVVVGNKTCRAYNLSDGKPLWTVDTGVPSGHGAAAGGAYYLPLREAAVSKQAEICAIDLVKGRVVAHASTASDEGAKPSVLGNLVFYNGALISQTNTEINAYPLLKVKLEQIDAALAKNPDDAEDRFGRAELRLSNGDAAGSVEDLQKAIENKPPAELLARMRGKLFEALTLLLQSDFAKGEKYLRDYEALCETGGSDDETRRRGVGFAALKGHGYEGLGRLLDALKAYDELAVIADDSLLPSPEDSAVQVRPSVLAQARIAELLRKATPEQRKELEEEIARRRKEAKESGKVEDLRSLAAAFGPSTQGGREVRLELAEQLMAKEGHAREVEILLTAAAHGDDPGQAARAVEALARFSVRLGLFEDAVHYYGVLNHDFGTTAIRDGKTGADFYKEAINDKRLLPFLEKPASFAAGKLAATEERDDFAYKQQVFQFARERKSLPFFKHSRLELQFNAAPPDKQELKLTDAAAGEPRWKTGIAKTQFQNIVTYNPQQVLNPAFPPGFANGPGGAAQAPPTPIFSYRTLGHLIVLPVGHMLFALDAVEGKVIWEKNLLQGADGRANPPPAGASVFSTLGFDARDGGVTLLYPDGWVQHLGPQALVLTPSAVCVMTHSGLTALDPLTGRTLWERNNVAPGSHLFGDEGHLFIVEVEAEKATRTQVLRTADGAAVLAPDFRIAYENGVQLVGRNLLTADSDKDGLTLRLLDPLAGKDLWKQVYPAKSIAMNSLANGFAGAVDPEGKVHVVDLRSLKEVLNASVDPKYLNAIESMHLLADSKYFYLACNGPMPPNTRVMSNLLPGTGLRDLPVNGPLYAFDAATGKMRWRFTAEKQRLLLSEFTESPIILLAARQMVYSAQFNGVAPTPKTVVLLLDKRVGKLLMDGEDFKGGPFHTWEVDAVKGRVELVAPQAKLVVTVREP